MRPNPILFVFALVSIAGCLPTGWNPPAEPQFGPTNNPRSSFESFYAALKKDNQAAAKQTLSDEVASRFRVSGSSEGGPITGGGRILSGPGTQHPEAPAFEKYFAEMKLVFRDVVPELAQVSETVYQVDAESKLVLPAEMEERIFDVRLLPLSQEVEEPEPFKYATVFEHGLWRLDYLGPNFAPGLNTPSGIVDHLFEAFRDGNKYAIRSALTAELWTDLKSRALEDEGNWRDFLSQTSDLYSGTQVSTQELERSTRDAKLIVKVLLGEVATQTFVNFELTKVQGLWLASSLEWLDDFLYRLSVREG
ncbi:MAG: hypothetical protein NUW37_03710 [Planctomycetes bacterium]|nr:hypothetical protein [Planctomycetota bacterium]